MDTILELFGFVAITVGVLFIFWPAGIIVGGVLAVVAGFLIES